MAEDTPEEVRAYLRRIGKAGGKAGGPARDAALSAKRKKEIAKKAATARWAKAKKASGESK